MPPTYQQSMIAHQVGEVFTPLPWAEWLIRRWGILDAWLQGATLCEPTAGKGAFILALLRLARAAGVEPTREQIGRITLIERNPDHLDEFRRAAHHHFRARFADSQLLARDVITDPPRAQYDLLLGNPPWANFCDLPSDYKEALKPHFMEAGLVPDRRGILLGSSRVDIAALVLKVVLGKLFNTGGSGHFFLPLSLFHGAGAHQGFRDYQAAGRRPFSVEEVCEFTHTRIFAGIAAAYCCARFTVDEPQRFPVRYLRQAADGWAESRAVPLAAPDDQWRVLGPGESADLGINHAPILLPRHRPRQGVNTGGANGVFIFDDKPDHLPERLLFPLATPHLWRESGQERAPRKWALLPYDREAGRPLTWSAIEQHPPLLAHLTGAMPRLKARRGALLRSTIARGRWWSLLGVGPYCFSPFKVMWEAYGRDTFSPLILGDVAGQQWQGNQAMHAFIPCQDRDEAQRILHLLGDPRVTTLLRQLNGEGKCNWAQPGKMRMILALLAGAEVWPA